MPMIGRFKYIICLFWFMFHSLRGLWLDLQLPVQSVPITTEVVSSNPAHGEVYSIQHYVIKLYCTIKPVGLYSLYRSSDLQPNSLVNLDFVYPMNDHL
jgi:hypothetical protein